MRTPYLLDDYAHEAMAHGALGITRSPFGLYDLVNDADRPTLVQHGFLPWWADPKLKIRFYRPLPSLLRWLDIRVLSGPFAMHLHSLAWWALVVLLASAFYRRVVSQRAALVATIIFALGPWHVLPLAWLANREVLLTIAAGIVALRCLIDRRFVLATLAFTLAFGCGEYAFCFGGYVLALAFIEDRRPRRVLGLLPFVLPALGYLAIRAIGGYGTFGSAFYADPLREPWKLVAFVPARLTMLVAESWLTFGTDPWGPSTPYGVVAACVLLVVPLFGLALRKVFVELTVDERRAVGWLLVGSLLALVPVLAAVPAPRLVGTGALGMAAVVGVLLERAWFPRDANVRKLPELVGYAATLFAFLQLVHGPIASYISGHTLSLTTRETDASLRAIAKQLGPHDEHELEIIRTAGAAFFGAFALADSGSPPRTLRVLSQSPHVLALVRNDHELDLTASDKDSLYPPGYANLYRDFSRPQHVGDVIDWNGIRIEILAVSPVGPTRARFTFPRPLKATNQLWFDDRIIGITPAKLPPTNFGAPFDP